MVHQQAESSGHLDTATSGPSLALPFSPTPRNGEPSAPSPASPPCSQTAENPHVSFHPIRRPPALKNLQPTTEACKRLKGPCTLSSDDILARRERRFVWWELREALYIQDKEKKAVREILGKEFRDICRAEIDEYVDCNASHPWAFLTRCRSQAKTMRQCLSSIETPEYVHKRELELMEQRECDGTSLVRKADRSQHNRWMQKQGVDGWLPSAPVSS
eukprot:GHVT01025121.1.p1 GENE.GHVT01025121.1~~GHVT01025121.1.p1  ORF type:complete len:217 (-),score=13.51 GHVT01025121.1:2018-2668(-)